MRLACRYLLKRQHKWMPGYLIPFCKIFNQNIISIFFRMINMLYKIFIESELYILSNGNSPDWNQKME